MKREASKVVCTTQWVLSYTTRRTPRNLWISWSITLWMIYLASTWSLSLKFARPRISQTNFLTRFSAVTIGLTRRALNTKPRWLMRHLQVKSSKNHLNSVIKASILLKLMMSWSVEWSKTLLRSAYMARLSRKRGSLAAILMLKRWSRSCLRAIVMERVPSKIERPVWLPQKMGHLPKKK